MITTPVRTMIRKIPFLKNLKTRYSIYSNTMITQLFGHKDYTRFMILSRSRTGSNYLRGLLNAHSKIIVYSELFKNNALIEWGLPGYTNTNHTLELFQNDPVAFLEKKAYRKYPRQIAAVGFKLFYYHARDSKWGILWPYLGNSKEIRIIHLKRKNILETHLSRQRALVTDKWANVSGDKEAQPTIPLNYEECLQDFVQTRAWERENDEYFSQHPLMGVYYEELASDYQREMEGIQAFLGVDSEPVAPQTFKQATLPLSKSITNYFELKKQFSGTPWEDFFSDD
jgi:LPS sulfotransferase NodH